MQYQLGQVNILSLNMTDSWLGCIIISHRIRLILFWHWRHVLSCKNVTRTFLQITTTSHYHPTIPLSLFKTQTKPARWSCGLHHILHRYIHSSMRVKVKKPGKELNREDKTTTLFSLFILFWRSGSFSAGIRYSVCPRNCELTCLHFRASLVIWNKSFPTFEKDLTPFISRIIHFYTNSI